MKTNIHGRIRWAFLALNNNKNFFFLSFSSLTQLMIEGNQFLCYCKTIEFNKGWLPTQFLAQWRLNLLTNQMPSFLVRSSSSSSSSYYYIPQDLCTNSKQFYPLLFYSKIYYNRSLVLWYIINSSRYNLHNESTTTTAIV